MNKMKIFSRLCLIFLILSGAGQLNAATVALNVSGNISESTIFDINVGDVFDTSFIYDSDSSVPVMLGGPLGTFYFYTGNQYGISGNVGSQSFNLLGFIDAFVTDNLPSSSFELIDPSLAGIVPAGNYDIFALNSYSSGLFDDAGDPVGTGIDVFFLLIGNEGLFSGITPQASPNDLLLSPELIGGLFFMDQYENGILTEYAIGDFSPVPVPAAVWLFGSGLLGIFGIMRRKQ